MPRKRTTTTTTAKTTKPKTPPAKRPALQPKSALGRALHSMVRLFLDFVDEDDFGLRGERQARRKEELIRGFLERDSYSVEYRSLRQLEDDIARVLLSDQVHEGTGQHPSREALVEAVRLAAALVDQVFELKQQRLKEIVPKAVAEVAREAKAAQEARLAAERQRQKAKTTSAGPKKTKGSGGKGRASSAKTKGKTKAKAKAKATAKGAGRASGKAAPKGRTSKAPATVDRDSEPFMGSKAKTKADRAPATAAKNGADDPKYAEALAHLGSLGRDLVDHEAISEIEEELGLPVSRAEAIFAAMEAKGDWKAVLNRKGHIGEYPKGADDPAYGRALLHLRGLGNHVEHTYAVDELQDELEISLGRAEGILEAMDANGDWPQHRPSSSTREDPGAVEASTPQDARPEKGKAAPSSSDPLADRVNAYVNEQLRLGKKVTPSSLKKAFRIGHGKATSLLAGVRTG